MSSFIFFDKITDELVLMKPGRLPQIPTPCVGDRIQLCGGKLGKIHRVLDKEWATVTAISPKNYIIVELDNKPGEIRITTFDVGQYTPSDSKELVPVRNPLSLNEWRELRGESECLQKERRYRRKLRQVMRNIKGVPQLTHS